MKALLVLLFVLFLALPVFASLEISNDPNFPASPDGNNITRDTATKLEWLDLTVTVGQSFNDVSSQFEEGNTLEGFRYAMSSDLFTLFLSSAGISDINQVIPPEQSVIDLQEMVGLTHFEPNIIAQSIGIYDDSVTVPNPNKLGFAELFVNIEANFSHPQIDVSDTPISFNLSREDIGSWLIRGPKQGVPCDFNIDGFCTTVDVDLMYGTGNLNSGVSVPPGDPQFDLNEDGMVNLIDLNQWLLDAGDENGFASPYLPGDADLNGIVNSNDLNLLALNWQGEERLWSAGDFNADGVVNSIDLNSIALNWRTSIPPAASQAAAVPEPSAVLLAVLAIAAMTRLRGRTHGS